MTGIHGNFILTPTHESKEPHNPLHEKIERRIARRFLGSLDNFKNHRGVGSIPTALALLTMTLEKMMEGQELFLKDGRSAGVWYCSKCKFVKRTKEEADQCCAPVLCACGKEVMMYHTLCNSCDHERLDRIWHDRMKSATLDSEHNGWIWSNDIEGSQEGYFQSVEELMDYVDDDPDCQMPEFAFATNCKVVTVDVEDIYENLDCNGYEEMSERASGCDELEAAIDAFNAINADTFIVYEADFKRKVMVKKTGLRKK